MKKLLFLCLAVALSFADEVKIAAAANTTYAFDEIKSEFNKLYPDTTLDVSLGASGALSTQIKNGAPFDIFMAADMQFAENIKESGFGVGDVAMYAKGKLALFTIRDFDLSKGLNALKDMKTITIANPATAPYGKASVEAMKNAKVYDEVESKIVQAKSIGEALSQALSASDAGFVAASAMYAPKMSEYKEGKNYILVDDKLYEPIAQGMIITKKGGDNPKAKQFYDFILSDKGKEIFAKYGYSF
ncbi:MAG: molybdate ABC transporter substrate-binding protein [Campylobacter sp.]|nr:molybdate ABC transporter substrate-binding protein [Campylobacter sp.]